MSGLVKVVSRAYLPEVTPSTLRLARITRALSSRGVEVEVICSDSNLTPQAHSVPDEIKVRHFPALPRGNGVITGYLSSLSYSLPLILRLLAARKPNVYLVEPMPLAGAVVRIASWLQRVPYVYYAATTCPEGAGKSRLRGSGLGQRLESFVIRGAAAVIAPGSEIAQRVKKLGARRVAIISSGVDTDVFRPRRDSSLSEQKARVGMDEDTPYFIYTGTASQEQGAKIFVEAFAEVLEQLPDHHILFFGQGTQWQEIGRIAQSCQGRVHLLPGETTTEISRWISGAEAALACLNPESGHELCYPTKVLAALACETPVIFAGHGAVARDIRDFDLGWTCGFDVELVAQFLVFAAHDPMGPKSRRQLRNWVQKYRSLDGTARAVADLLEVTAKPHLSLQLSHHDSRQAERQESVANRLRLGSRKLS